ncbi:hypothetical protein E2320_007409, partial [Naja naja]
FSGSLNGQHWRFLRSNLDYSRDAFLPSGESILTQLARGPSPLLLSENRKNLLRAPQRSRNRLTEPQSYTSKLSLMSQTQKDHIAQVEYCLSQHPLALYPNFQESIPEELFKEVMSILDPEMVPTDENLMPTLVENPVLLLRFHPFWKTKGTDKQGSNSLFDVGCDTTLLMFHPLCVEELRDLPMDLKKYFGMPPPEAIRKEPDQDVKSSKDPCQSRWKKMRYGAWYLDPKTWKKQNVNEPLENPKESSLKNSRRLLSEEDAKLIQVHGTHAFQEFLQMLEEQNGVEAKVGALKNTKDESQKCKELRENYSP